MIERRTCDCATSADQVAELRERVRALEELVTSRGNPVFGQPTIRAALAYAVQMSSGRSDFEEVLRRYDDLVDWRT